MVVSFTLLMGEAAVSLDYLYFGAPYVAFASGTFWLLMLLAPAAVLVGAPCCATRVLRPYSGDPWIA